MVYSELSLENLYKDLTIVLEERLLYSHGLGIETDIDKISTPQRRITNGFNKEALSHLKDLGIIEEFDDLYMDDILFFRKREPHNLNTYYIANLLLKYDDNIVPAGVSLAKSFEEEYCIKFCLKNRDITLSDVEGCDRVTTGVSFFNADKGYVALGGIFSGVLVSEKETYEFGEGSTIVDVITLESFMRQAGNILEGRLKGKERDPTDDEVFLWSVFYEVMQRYR